MYAIKGNVQYTIQDEAAEAYKAQGFDIYDAKGKKVGDAVTKTIPYVEHLAALAKVKTGKTTELEAKIAELTEQLETVAAERDKLLAAAGTPEADKSK